MPEISPEEILEIYVHKQISLIPQHGDKCLWLIASACDLFRDLNPDGTLTPSQKLSLESFVRQLEFAELLNSLTPLQMRTLEFLLEKIFNQ